MEIKLILLIFGASQIFANTLPNSSDYYYPAADDNALLYKMLFSKINTLLLDNQEFRQNLLDLNKRITNLTDLVQSQQNNETEPQNCTGRLAEAEIMSSQSQDTQNTILDIPQRSKRRDYINEKNLDTNYLNCEWTVIQRREDGSENFYRNWTEYKFGFGNPKGEFFIGLEKLHKMTTAGKPKELLIILGDFANQTRYAKYDRFSIGNETEKYGIIEIGKYSGDAGDDLVLRNGYNFTTKDQDNDRNFVENCAVVYKGAWWFDNCYNSHLNGPYLQGELSERGGINWWKWHGYNYSLKFVEIMIA